MAVQQHDNVVEVILCRHLLVVVDIAREHIITSYQGQKGAWHIFKQLIIIICLCKHAAVLCTYRPCIH